MRKLTGKLILYSNILLATLLLLSYLAPYINPGKFLLPAFLGLAYPYLLLLNLIFVVYWALRIRKEILISLVVIFIGWGHLMNFLPLNPRQKPSSEPVSAQKSFSLMSYNVRTFDQYNWEEEPNTLDGIYKVIADEAPDILCIQEFFTANRIGFRERDVKRRLSAYPAYSIYYSMKTGPDSGFGIATFSKYPILKTSRIPFDNTLNQAVYTDMLIGIDTIRLFNIHLQSIRFGQNNYSFMDTLSFKYSNRQFEEVKDIGKRLRDAFVQRAEQAKIIQNYVSDSPYPVIVSGDFNDTPLSYAYRRIKKGLHDAFRESGRGLGNTYAGDLPSFRIDFIMHSKDLSSKSFSRIKSKYSDHFPILSTIEIKPADSTTE